MHYCIESDNGNLFTKATAGKEKIYFYIHSMTGEHLTKKKDFHSVESYEQAKKTWKNEEIPLPDVNIPHAEAVVASYLEQKDLMAKKYAKKGPATNSMAEAFAKVGIRK